MNELNCIFCQNCTDEDCLIEINHNAVEFDNAIIEFSEIVEEIFNKKIRNKEESLICETCKDQLVQFYVFSENVKSNNFNFIQNENLEKCRSFLSECQEYVNCISYNDSLLLIPDSKLNAFSTLDLFEPTLDEGAIRFEDLDYQTEESSQPKIDEMFNEIESTSNLIEQNELDESEIINVQDEEIQQSSHDKSTSFDLNTSNQIIYNCSKCEFSTEDQVEYNQHMSTHISSSSRRYTKLFCTRCKYQFTTQAHFTAHLNGHNLFDTLAKFMTYPKCKECNIMFIDDDHYENHIKNDHSVNPVDSIGFFLKFGIKGDDHHKEEEDPSLIVAENSPKCGHCMKQIGTDEELIKHLLIFHAKTLICPVDLRSFKNNQAFTIHMRNNHPELFPNSSFVCSVCKNEFETLYEKLSHMKVCKEKSFNCQHCSKSFSRKCHLVKHLKLVSGELNITCEKCNKVCRDNHDYKIHARSHSTEKVFSCSLCPKTYKTSSARAAHLQSHLEVILCPHCNLQFKSRRTMQKHVKTKHEKVKVIKSIRDIEMY